MSQQNGLDHDGTELSKSDHDDGMQKKSENVAHAQDGIKLSKLKNSGPLVEFATDRSDLELDRRIPLSDLGQSPGPYNMFVRNVRQVRYGAVYPIEVR